MFKSVFRFSLRIPKDLHKELKKLAEKNSRSLNNQIIYILGQWVKKEKDAS